MIKIILSAVIILYTYGMSSWLLTIVRFSGKIIPVRVRGNINPKVAYRQGGHPSKPFKAMDLMRAFHRVCRTSLPVVSCFHILGRASGAVRNRCKRLFGLFSLPRESPFMQLEK